MVTAALETASLFLPPGTKIVTVRGRHVPEKSEVVPSIAKPYTFKLAILVNEKTASSSEIVSGAMQDHDRATIVGTTSFGKGLVQSVFPMSENTGMALTTALYYTPSGRSIQKPLDAAKFGLGATTAHPNKQSEFHTDKGRLVTGGGGIQPDIRRAAAAHEPPARRARRQRILHQLRHRVPALEQSDGGFRGHARRSSAPSRSFYPSAASSPASPNGPSSAISSRTA